MKNNLRATHPGKIIKQGLDELNLSNAEAARILGCSRAFIGDVIHGKRNLSAKMCFKISGLLGSTPEMWSRLQMQYDLKLAAKDKSLMAEVNKIGKLSFTEESVHVH